MPCREPKSLRPTAVSHDGRVSPGTHEHEDRRIFEHGPRQRHPLLLAAAEPDTTLADDRVVAVGKGKDSVVDARRLGDLDDPFARRRRVSVRDLGLSARCEAGLTRTLK